MHSLQKALRPDLRRGEDGRCGGDTGANARLEVAPDARFHGRGPAVGLEALEVEVEALGPPPEVRVVDVAAVGVERVDHLEEASLDTGSLGGGVQGG
jgi:hypothetical protein